MSLATCIGVNRDRYGNIDQYIVYINNQTLYLTESDLKRLIQSCR